MTRKQILKILKHISTSAGLKLEFHDWSGGSFYPDAGIVRINPKLPKSLIISIFFHEFAHAVRASGGQGYYWRIKRETPTELFWEEIETDKLGKQLCAQWFPEIKYHQGYKNNEWTWGFIHGCLAR